MSTYTDPVVEFDPELEYQTVVMQQQLVTKILGALGSLKIAKLPMLKTTLAKVLSQSQIACSCCSKVLAL